MRGEKEAGKKQSAKTQAYILLYWLNENYFHWKWSYANLLMKCTFPQRFSTVVNNNAKFSNAMLHANME